MEKEEVLVKIGAKIRSFREEKKITQQDLAAACNFEKSNMCRIENGRNNLTIGTLIKICLVLEIKLVHIVDIDLDINPN